jgi:hypothetical protein
MYRGHLAHAKVPVTWEAVMPKTDLLEQSAPRVELDQRSREARLRLERVQRLLLVNTLPTQSLLRRLLRCFASRVYAGEQIAGRSAHRTPTRGRSRGRRQMTAETGGVSEGIRAALPVSWPNPSKCDVPSRANSGSPIADPAAIRGGLKPWRHSCEQGASRFRLRSDERP